MANVFLFVPNLIGYARIVLALIALWLMPTSPLAAISCYLSSCLLDSFDGYAARLMNQCSTLGVMLDMLTDRCTTLCLMVTLAVFYPSLAFLFQVSMALDVSSHWMHMHSVTLGGSRSHKLIDLSGNRILRHYYSNKMVLFLMCTGNELFYASLYVLHFTEGPRVPGLDVGMFRFSLWLSTPVWLAKSLVSLVQLGAAAHNLGSLDQCQRAGVLMPGVKGE